MARVSHSHMVPVYDVGTFGPHVFLAMQLVEAQTLSEWLKAAPRPWQQVRALFLDAAGASRRRTRRAWCTRLQAGELAGHRGGLGLNTMRSRVAPALGPPSRQ